MRIEIKIQRQQTLAQHKRSHQVRAHRNDSCSLGFHNPLCCWGRYLTVNSLLVGCSRIQELMAKIFAGLTGRCQHPSLNTNYIISTMKAAMENWRIQIQVPGGMLCLVPAINPSQKQCSCLPPIYGRGFIAWQIRVSRGCRADSQGFAPSQSISN